MKLKTISTLLASVWPLTTFGSGLVVNENETLSQSSSTYQCSDTDCPSEKSTIYVKNNGSLFLNDALVNWSGNGNGIRVENGSAKVTNTEINSSGQFSTGVAAIGPNAQIEIVGGKIVTTSSDPSSGNVAIGESVSATNGYISLSDVVIESSGIAGTGLSASSEGKITMTGGSLHFFNKGGDAITTLNNGIIQLNKVFDIKTGNQTSVGIRASDGGVIQLNNSKIEHQGTREGIIVDQSYVSLGNQSSLTTTSDNSIGANIGYKGILSITGNSSIVTKGNQAAGILLGQMNEPPPIRSLEAGTSTNFDFDDGLAYLESSQVTTEGNNSHGIMIDGFGNLVTFNSNIKTLGDKSSALLLASVNLDTNKVHLENSHFESKSGSTILLQDVIGTLDIFGGSVVNTNGKAIHLEHAMNMDPSHINISKNANIVGDIFSDGNHDTLNFNSSYLKGSIEGMSDTNFDNNSRWDINKESNINGSLTNNGTIKFEKTNNQFINLNVAGDLNGNGSYEMNTNLGTQQSDKILIGGQVTGKNSLLVYDSGYEPSSEGEKLTMISASGNASGNGDFNLKNKDGYVNVGTYKYELIQKNENNKTNWVLVNTGRLSDLTTSVTNFGNIALSQGLWFEQINSLRKRLGNLRLLPAQNGTWIRTYASQVDFDNGTLGGTDQKIHGVAFGYDKKFSVGESDLFIGARIDHAKSDQDFNPGSGKIKSNDLALYASYFAHNGFYADLMLSRSRRDHFLNVKGSDGKSSEANYRDYATGLSLELGKQIQFNNRWFVEPQVELSYLHLGSNDYTTSNGMQVALNTGNSLQARVGMLLGQQYQLSENMGQWYIKSGFKSDLLLDRKVTINHTLSNNSDKDKIYYIGFGIDQVISKNNLMYTSFEYENGKKFNRPWSYSVGFRKNW